MPFCRESTLCECYSGRGIGDSPPPLLPLLRSGRGIGDSLVLRSGRGALRTGGRDPELEEDERLARSPELELELPEPEPLDELSPEDDALRVERDGVSLELEA